MADVLVERRSLENIADAIRTKLGTSELIKPEDFADEIMKIEPCEEEYGTIVYFTDESYTTTSSVKISTQEELNSMANADCCGWSTTVGGVNITSNNIKQLTLSSYRPLVLPVGFLSYSYNLDYVDLYYSKITAIPSSFMLGSNRFNGVLNLPSSLVSIGDSFLGACSDFNGVLTLPATLSTIGNDFMPGCTSFNKTVVLPNSVITIGSGFLYNCQSLNSPVVLSSGLLTIGEDFMFGCDAMTSTVDVGNLSADTIVPETPCVYTFVTEHSYADSWLVGITLIGANASAWKERYPDHNNEGGCGYRKLLLANQEER